MISGYENGQVSIWTAAGKLYHTWQAHTSSGVNTVQMSPDLIYILSGAQEVCVYNLAEKTAQLTCWNATEVTSVEWVDRKKFLVAETSGMITLDKVHSDYFTKVHSVEISGFCYHSDLT